MDEKKGKPISSWADSIGGIVSKRRIPRATYRLQFDQAFTFRDARTLVPYLDDLGIGDCYASPLFKTCFDDSHGYDICDHTELNPALGTPEEFEAFAADLQARRMGLILDVVPNHMGISGARNGWWMDVLENGPSSAFSSFFDIDWHPVKPELENKVLLPILEDQYGKVLESGKFQLKLEEGAFFIYYYANKLPVAPRTYRMILSYPLDDLTQVLGKENEDLQELQSILTAISYLPSRTELSAEKLDERKREKEIIKRRIAGLYQKSAKVRAAIDRTLEAFNGTGGDPRSFDLLDGLLKEQVYRPAFWRVASDEINYRRFFDINNLAAIRMELPEVFQATHQLIFPLLNRGQITGLRIDHPDGLWNPANYFRHLQVNYLLQQIQAGLAPPASSKDAPLPESMEMAVCDWVEDHLERKEVSTPCWPLYVVAEKILCEGESLPDDWAVCGTTGYDFLNAVNGLFVDGRNRRALERIYNHFTGSQIHFGNLVNSTKKMIMLISMASEVNALSHQLERLSEKNRGYRDFTLNSLTFAIREVIACLPVYRTYIAEPRTATARDQAYVEAATREAKRRNPRTAEAIFDFIRDTLLLRNIQNFPEEDRWKLVDFVMEFQQITGPVMAKGVEDTAFYVYNRLVSLNEVGGHPDQFGIPVAAFHQQNRERQRNWPHSLLATSTHDTKRSEDVRARINVLSEIPGEWRATLSRWSRLNAAKKTSVDGQPAPDRNDEYLLYQTLIGAWPAEPASPEELNGFGERIAAYMHKATMEAKSHTSWVNPNKEYDAAVHNFVYRLLDTTKRNRFLEDFKAFQRRVAYFGQFNALAQVLLKLTSPGVPDIYQGTELWDFSLVDPDNRRPVDYLRRRSLLTDLKDRVERSGGDLIPLVGELLADTRDGRIKLYLIYQTLNFRRAHPQLFSSGTYLPLEAMGEKKDNLCAFARIFADEAVLVVAPRLVVGLTGGAEKPPLGRDVWKDTALALSPDLAGKSYRHLFTGEWLPAENFGGTMGLSSAAIFGHFPVALLERGAN
jgi:(1->4)-alpha-D-glucan 1-alpha-D-glucosylmutase